MAIAARVESEPVERPMLGWIGLQPIFDSRSQVRGYELLYRGGPTGDAWIRDGNQATSSTLVNAFLDMGIDELCGGERAYVNMTRELLLSEAIEALPPHKVALEVLETVEIDAALIARLKQLSSMGFWIALDDFRYESSKNHLVEIADVVKVDVLTFSADELAQQVTALRAFRRPMLLAEKVEDQARFDQYVDLGFDLFQGYYLKRPELISRKKMPESKLSVLRLIAKLQDPKTPTAELESLISADVTLAYRMLRFLSSARFSHVAKIDSVQRALVMLGRERLRNWVTLVALANLDERSPALLEQALVRAKMCSELAVVKRQAADAGLTAGLFSLLDAMMQSSMEDIVAALPLSQELEDALLRRGGKTGQLLKSTEEYVDGRWDEMDLLGLPPETFSDAYFKAMRWALDMCQELQP